MAAKKNTFLDSLPASLRHASKEEALAASISLATLLYSTVINMPEETLSDEERICLEIAKGGQEQLCLLLIDKLQLAAKNCYPAPKRKPYAT